MAGVNDFLNYVIEASRFLRDAISQQKIIFIFSHYDADGLSSAGILGRALLREDTIFHIRILRQLEEAFVKEIPSLSADSLTIFLDFGSGQIDLLEKYIKNRNIIIIDHHEVVREELENSNWFQINPHIFGIDGSIEISSAGITYLLVKYLDESKNRDLSSMAVVGALGDLQDKGKQNSLIGLNAEIIVKDGIKSKVLTVTKGFTFFGQETRPIHIAIEYCIDPYIPGLSGNRSNVLRFLKKIGLELKDENGNWKTLAGLSVKEKKLLASELILYMSQHGLSSREMKSIIGTLYVLNKEREGTPLRDAREFATLLNSCGRMDAPDVGALVAMGFRRKSYKEALSIYSSYKNEISKALDWLYNNRDKIIQLEYIQAFHGESFVKDTVIGTVASIALNSRILKTEKPVIAFSYSDDDTVKVSARTTITLVSAGVNLAEALRSAALKISPDLVAGGHNIAAGARIPKGSEDTFLKYVNQIISEQLNKVKGMHSDDKGH